MKTKWKFLAVTMALLAGLAAVLIRFLLQAIPSYDEMAERDFGGPAQAAVLTALYERIEARSPAGLGLVEVQPIDSSEFGFPKTFALPKNLIPKECASRWLGRPATEERSLATWWEVLAHYDENDRLQALEFYGSRYGGFVSRDPGLKPKMPGNLKQLHDGPIHITARITGEPD
jgi:hypothetical protein